MDANIFRVFVVLLNVIPPDADMPVLNVCSAVNVFATDVVTPVTAPVSPLNDWTPIFVIVTDPVAPLTAIPVPATAAETP